MTIQVPEHAPCKITRDPDVFFKTDAKSLRHAKALCQSCPIRIACRDYARRNLLWGVWGGESEAERRKAGWPPAYFDVLTSDEVVAPPTEDPDQPYDPRPPHRRGRRRGAPPPCGTKRGWLYHRNNKERVCDECKEWKRLDTEKQARPKRPRLPAICGTHSAYSRHKKKGEEIKPLTDGGCGCLEAEAAYSASRRARRREDEQEKAA